MRTNDFARFNGRLTIQGILELVTPLRIGAGGSDDMGTADITVVKDALGYPYIPGSSFKGVLRSQVESLLRTMNEELACLCVTFADYDDDPPGSQPHCPTTLRNEALKARVAFLREQDANPRPKTAVIWIKFIWKRPAWCAGCLALPGWRPKWSFLTSSWRRMN
ncbi:MAG: RAMP superfamily CRISPR-associated protein [Chloroflexi bacterium]|nr:RAMP superfamily CRISPR-associated protein [Chloroflexota bacterium]